MPYILAINPGSTSTKIALFDGANPYKTEYFSHSAQDIERFEHAMDQKDYRKDIIMRSLAEHHIGKGDLSAVVGRGGLLRSIPGGCYEVDAQMLDDMKQCIRGEHVSNLGAVIANEIAQEYGVKAYIVDPVSVDEFEPLARISGIPQIERKSMVHALNCRAMAHRYAEMRSSSEGSPVSMSDVNLIIAHLGGGISVVPMKRGRMIDANNANEMGPFSSERAGGLPVGDFVELCFSGLTQSQVKSLIRGKGGLAGYLGTNDIRAIEASGDPEKQKYLEALAYQVAKEIGASAAVLEGKVDAIILTGGAAHSEIIAGKVRKMTSFIAEVILMPGEDELSALATGVRRILEGSERAKNYTEESARYEAHRRSER